MQLRLISDLHLESQYGGVLPTTGREESYSLNRKEMILVIAGDLSPLSCRQHGQYLREVCSLYQLVIYIAGNHEFYEGIERRIGIKHLREVLCALPELLQVTNLVVLDNQYFDLPALQIRFLGTTLWSAIPPEPAVRTAITMRVRDYQRIFVESPENDGTVRLRPMTIQDSNRWHQEARTFLEHHWHPDPTWRNIVISHHAPCTMATSAPEYQGQPTNCAFATDLPELLAHSTLWLFGHTHWHCNRLLNKTRLANCPQGYTGESTGAIWNGVIDLRDPLNLTALAEVPLSIRNPIGNGDEVQHEKGEGVYEQIMDLMTRNSPCSTDKDEESLW